MSENVTEIFPPSSLEEVIALINEMPDAQFEAFREDILQNAFEEHENRCSQTGTLLKLSSETVALLLNALAFLYSRLHRIQPEKIKGALQGFVKSFQDDAASAGREDHLLERLLLLLSPNEDIDAARKTKRLRLGFLKNATGFASFVDVRPDFSDSGDKIRGFVPMTQFRISTDSEDPSQKDFVFQIDDSGLSALRKALDDADDKIATLRAANMLSAPLYRANWIKDA